MLWTVALAALLGCGTPSSTPDAPAAGPAEAEAPAAAEAVATPSEPLDVRALSFPAAWLVDRVGGDAVTVLQITPVGEDPPHWQPSGDVIASLADADLIVANGAGFEAWTATASLPTSKVVDTAKGLELLEIAGKTHSHGEDGEHSHAGTDPHTWSDPLGLLLQAKAVHAALSAARPGAQATLDAGLEALQRDLTALHEELATALAPAKGRPVAANHPAYNYLARRYDLDLTSFDFDPEVAPSAEDLDPFVAWMQTAGAEPVLLWESTPSADVIGAFPEGVQHVPVDPLEQPAGATYDYLKQARTNAIVFRRLFAPPEADAAGE